MIYVSSCVLGVVVGFGAGALASLSVVLEALAQARRERQEIGLVIRTRLATVQRMAAWTAWLREDVDRVLNGTRRTKGGKR